MPLPLFRDQRPQASHSHPLEGVQAVVAIAAGKGGVGKSTVTVNLALALLALGYQVGIMDADLYGPSIRKMLPEERLPEQKGERLLPALAKGIKMISMAYFRKEGEAAAVRAPIANGLIAHFINKVDWGPLDFLLVDFPPGTGDVQISLSQHAHISGAVMVATPQEVALLDVRKAMSLFNQVKVPILGIVENMSYFQPSEAAEPAYLFGRGGGERLALEAHVPFLGTVPLDPFLCSCADQGRSIFEGDPAACTQATRAFQQLARQFLLQVKEVQSRGENGAGAFELIWKEMPE